MSISNSGWKNKRGTATHSPTDCTTWRAYWEEHTNEEWPRLCSEKSCCDKAVDGAHLFNSAYGKDEWIVPLCKKCNSVGTESFDLVTGVAVVSANQSKSIMVKYTSSD